MQILETNKLCKKFNGVKAVDDMSIYIKSGQITGLVGPNGSGKTTLLHLLSGVLPIDSGSIFVNGAVLKKIEPYQIINYGITRTFQDVRLFNQMTVLDNILIALTKREVLESLREKYSEYHFNTAKKILTKISLWDKRDDLAINLSYGQRKLLEIGRALSTKADIFLFDEPFAGLFPEMRKLVADLITEIKTQGKAVVLIEHDMDIIRSLCDYIFVLDSGSLIAKGDPNDAFKNEKVIEAYLGN